MNPRALHTKESSFFSGGSSWAGGRMVAGMGARCFSSSWPTPDPGFLRWAEHVRAGTARPCSPTRIPPASWGPLNHWVAQVEMELPSPTATGTSLRQGAKGMSWNSDGFCLTKKMQWKAEHLDGRRESEAWSRVFSPWLESDHQERRAAGPRQDRLGFLPWLHSP